MHLALLTTLFFVSTAQAEAPRVEECDISVGTVMMCYGGFSGAAVAQKDGRYYNVDTVEGHVDAWKGLFTGKTVVMREDRYQRCELSHGVIKSCEGNFNGRAVVLR